MKDTDVKEVKTVGEGVGFERIRKLAEDNEDLILALHNHIHALMAEYAEDGFCT